MFLDALEMFDTNSAITAGGPSMNTLDLGSPRDIGIGDDPAMKLALYVLAAFVGAGATLNVQFQGSADNVNWYTHAESSPIPVATLTAGEKLFPIDVPHRAPGQPIPRYLRLNYVVTGGPFTAGAVEAGLVLGRDDAPAYPSGFSPAN